MAAADKFTALITSELLQRTSASNPASRSPQSLDDASGGGSSELLCGCVVLGPPPRSGLVFCSGDGVRLTSDDLVTVRLVADAAMVMHPQGEPRVITLCGMQYTVARCERAHVLAVSKDEEHGVVVSALPLGVLVSMYTAPVKMPEVAAAVFRFAALLRT
eukprot:m.110586 g.110586  ORF g.110586 m.110586 type:complete len:160 (+) comp21314_c0_seq1:236-715(+)